MIDGSTTRNFDGAGVPFDPDATVITITVTDIDEGIRLTEGGDYRITEDGSVRVLEAA